MAALTWPSLRNPEEFDWYVESVEAVGGDDRLTSSGLISVTSRYARVQAMLSWNNVTQLDALSIEAFLGRLRGMRRTVAIPNLKYITKIGTSTGAWTVNGAHARGAWSIAKTGSGTFAAGEWIEIEQLTPRAYQVLADTGSALEIAPPLHEAVSAGRAIKHLGDGTTTVIHDTMELTSEIGPAMMFPSPAPHFVSPREVKFRSARRRAY